VVELRLPELPSLEQPVREVLEALAVERREDRDDDLVRRLALERGELALDRRLPTGVEQAGVVVDARGRGRRHIDRADGPAERDGEDGRDEERAQPRAR